MNRWIKPVMIGLAGLTVVMLAFSVLMPDHVMTSKWVIIPSGQKSVIQEVRNLGTWESWNLLVRNGQQISATDSSLQWVSGNGYHNSIQIDTVNERGIATTLRLNQGRPMISGFSVEQKNPAVDSVQVVWYIIEELKWYPWEKFYGMMAADVKGPVMDSSLQLLKSHMEGR